jgi:hypothetical protein
MYGHDLTAKYSERSRTAIIWTTAQGYLYGIAAPFWYAAGVSIQIALMTVLAIHAKVKVP